ncbi:MAG: threonylcarbamoyl-AMP synthase [Chloroflexi bacterium]|nr:threonylcarbamoyl-AMP synthase [Chloroflexota bacterium]
METAVSILLQGGVVAFPTDTLYALGAHAFIETAVRRVYRVKQRPLDMALPLLLADARDMEKVALHIPQMAWDLAEQFWPGALTLVLHKGPSVSALVTAGKDTVAVRVPNHPLALKLIEAVGTPLTGTSANKSGQGDPVTAEDVRQQLGEELDLILDGGACPLEAASTIVDLTLDTPRIVREGAIPASLLEQVCPGVGKAVPTGERGKEGVSR